MVLITKYEPSVTSHRLNVRLKVNYILIAYFHGLEYSKKNIYNFFNIPIFLFGDYWTADVNVSVGYTDF